MPYRGTSRQLTSRYVSNRTGQALRQARGRPWNATLGSAARTLLESLSADRPAYVRREVAAEELRAEEAQDAVGAGFADRTIAAARRSGADARCTFDRRAAPLPEAPA